MPTGSRPQSRPTYLTTRCHRPTVDRALTEPRGERRAGRSASAEFSAGFLLDLAARRRQIGCVDHYHARRAAGSMNKLLERLKQGLRSIGHGRSDGHDVSRASHAVSHRERDTSLRTELDDAPSRSTNGRHQPHRHQACQPAAREGPCCRKARRTSGPQDAMTLWGPAPTSPASLFDDSGAPAPAPLLTGSTFVPLPPPTKAGPRRSPLVLLEGEVPFGTSGRSAEAAKASSPLDTANPFTPDDDAIDRLFSRAALDSVEPASQNPISSSATPPGALARPTQGSSACGPKPAAR